ncbi:MFS transporter [Niallia sp. 03133]|uniref:MFS transporter n=1 Tax=Niallia sp. 03133 TaxID=3458060 RepID=UPI004044FFE6
MILCFGQFLAMAAMSCISPFLPLYISELGISDPDKVSFWSGIIFGVNFLTAFLFAPIWGKLADVHGRKIMVIRSGLGMAVITVLMGVVNSPVQLLILRLLNGVVAGFIPASIALTSTITPKKRVGHSLGILQAFAVSGSICGPILGGLMADVFGFSVVFYMMGILLCLATLLILFFVKEDFKKGDIKEKSSLAEDFKQITKDKTIPALFIAATIIQLATVGITPLISVFVQELSHSSKNLAFLSGVTIAVMGVSNMLASPKLGKLGDKWGAQNILLYSVILAAICMIPLVFVTEIWQLFVFLFGIGLSLGGMLPSINALIRLRAPIGMESRAFGYSNSAIFLGNMLGPIIAGTFSTHFGIRSMFVWGSLLLMTNAVWVKYGIIHKLKEKSFIMKEQNFYK